MTTLVNSSIFKFVYICCTHCTTTNHNYYQNQILLFPIVGLRQANASFHDIDKAHLCIIFTLNIYLIKADSDGARIKVISYRVRQYVGCLQANACVSSIEKQQQKHKTLITPSTIL